MHPFWCCAPLPPKGETTHYILCVAVLLQNVFAVHPGGGSLLYAYLPAERVILSRRRRISVHGDSETLVDKYKSVGMFRRFRGWWYPPWGDEFIGCLGGLLCFEYLFDFFPPAPPRHFVALSPSRGRKGRGSLQPHKKIHPFSGWIFIYFFSLFFASFLASFFSRFSSSCSSNCSTISSGSLTLNQKE